MAAGKRKHDRAAGMYEHMDVPLTPVTVCCWTGEGFIGGGVTGFLYHFFKANNSRSPPLGVRIMEKAAAGMKEAPRVAGLGAAFASLEAAGNVLVEKGMKREVTFLEGAAITCSSLWLVLAPTRGLACASFVTSLAAPVVTLYYASLRFEDFDRRFRSGPPSRSRSITSI